MYLQDVKNIDSKAVNPPGATMAFKQILVGPQQGWAGWVMRLFTLGKGGCTPQHSHPWPHINYIVKGTGTLLMEDEEREIGSDYVAYISGGAVHQFKNTGESELSFICIVPEEGEI
jgi:quercetin dioxygenase-like cupin family protein